MPEFDSTHVVQVIGVQKMPFGKYENFEDCVRQNRGKVSDPEAYCATIKRKVEGENINVANEVLMQLGEIKEGLLQNAQLMPIGKWHHPLGEINITSERARRFADQFKRSVTGQKLPVLWIHSDKGNVSNPSYGKAAGWITDMRADEKLGLLVDIQFTPEGEKAVNSKEFSYLSAEYFDQVMLPHHEAPESDVVVAAALVNRPHLKGMNPLLNEETGHQFLLGAAGQEIKGGVMDPVILELCQKAGIKLSENQTELTEEQRKGLTKFYSDQEKELTDSKTKVGLLETQVATLEDPDKKKARSLEQAGFTEEARLLSEYRADRFVAQLNEDVPEGHRLSPVAEKEARIYALSQTSENLAALHKTILSGKGVVDLSERGTVGEGKPDEGGQGVADLIMAESQKIAEEKKISLGEAMSEYARANPKKWNEYQESMGAPMAKVGGV